jgi:hypothetical protein
MYPPFKPIHLIGKSANSVRGYFGDFLWPGFLQSPSLLHHHNGDCYRFSQNLLNKCQNRFSESIGLLDCWFENRLETSLKRQKHLWYRWIMAKSGVLSISRPKDFPQFRESDIRLLWILLHITWHQLISSPNPQKVGMFFMNILWFYTYFWCMTTRPDWNDGNILR